MPTTTLSPQPGRWVPPIRKTWTVDEFHDLWTRGAFADNRVALVNGEIYEMAIPGPPHNMVVGEAMYRLLQIFGDKYWIRVQMPLVLGTRSDPEPDLAVVSGRPRDYANRQPTTAALVVEVSDTSLAFDLREKAFDYAAGGVADYWVADINGHRLIVHRDPVADPASPTGSRYGTVLNLGLADAVAPLAVPTASVAVAELLG